MADKKRNVPREVKRPKQEPKKLFGFLPAKSAYYILYIAIIGFIVYSAFTLTNINLQKAEKERQLEELESQINIQEIKNEDLKDICNYSNEELLAYAEKIAREDLGYVKSGERIFVNVAGD